MSNNVIYAVVGLLILAVVGLAVDRSNQITSLTEQAQIAADSAQENADNLSATIEAQAEAVTVGEEAMMALETQVAISSTAFEDELSEASSAIEVLESQNVDFATQVAEQADEIDIQVNLVETQSALAAEAQEDAELQADIAATSEAGLIVAEAQIADSENALATLEADNSALIADLEALIPTETPMPEPTVVEEVSGIDFTFQLEMDNTGAVEIAPDGESIAILRDDNVIEFVSAEDGTPQRELGDFEEDLDSFTFSNNGRLIGAVASFSRMLVFDAATGVNTLDEAIRNPIKSYSFAGDDGAIAVLTGLETEIFVFDPSPRVTRIGGVALDWSVDGSKIVTTDGSLLEILDIADYQIDGVTEGEADSTSILDVAYSPDSSLIAGITADAMVIVWDGTSGEQVWSSETSWESIDDFDWSGDSAHLVVVADGSANIYSADGNSTTSLDIDGITSVDWSADSAFIVFASESEISVVSADSLE